VAIHVGRRSKIIRITRKALRRSEGHRTQHCRRRTKIVCTFPLLVHENEILSRKSMKQVTDVAKHFTSNDRFQVHIPFSPSGRNRFVRRTCISSTSSFAPHQCALRLYGQAKVSSRTCSLFDRFDDSRLLVHSIDQMDLSKYSSRNLWWVFHQVKPSRFIRAVGVSEEERLNRLEL